MSLRVAASSWRGDALENSHLAHVAVVDGQGRLLRWFGDPHRFTLARSAAKPAQALAVLESGALTRFGFDSAELALMCASHSSEAVHLEGVRRMLARIGASESDLRCGGHPALSEAVQRAWLRQDFRPGPLCSNCSGKHVGMLAAARALGLPIADYHAPGHVLQQRIRATVAELFALPEDGVGWALDGCNLPTPAAPLDRLARFYAALAAAADGQDALQPGPSRCAALAAIFHAMTTHPALVAGTGRFCTVLMDSFAGSLVGKVGADASYAIGVRAGPASRALGADGAVGIAIKVEDGNTAVVQAIACEVLLQLGVSGPAQQAALAAFHTPVQRNTVGAVTGSLRLDLVLEGPPAG